MELIHLTLYSYRFPDEINIYLSEDSTTGPSILDGSITIDSVTGGVLPCHINGQIPLVMYFQLHLPQ